MAFLFGWNKKPQAPERVPTDTVIPLHKYDDTTANRSICIDFTMRFDDVLDAEKLSGALTRLMEKGHWRKLGARLRLKSNDKLEYHVPASFSAERPAYSYSHEKYETKISEHPLASQLPRASTKPAVLGSVVEFRPLFRTANTPTKLADWIYTDRPQLSLHIVSFEDATLVSLNWLHTLLDGMGRNALLRAWTMMLDGRESEVPEPYGYDFDPLASLGTSHHEKLEEKSVLAPKQLKGLGMMIFAIRFVFDLLWHKKEDNRIVCIPPSYLQSIKNQALVDLQTTANLTDPAPFLSDGDVLAAWWTKIATSHLPQNSTKTILTMNVFGMRDALAPDLLPPTSTSPYIANCVIAFYSYISLQALRTQPLGLSASFIRHAITTQSPRPQIEAFCWLQQASIAETGHAPVFGDPWQHMICFSNWSKGRMFETDFSAAVVREGSRSPRQLPGRPSWISADGFTEGFSVRNSFPVLGRDAEGNYWLAGSMRTELWDGMERVVEAL